ncbi:TonB-dependent receptor [Pontibacter sp. E15-1]|uniref:SusC/RagA family TonB-linked outer membrane protein n=1 Tax=Pontibacter sp. E15-1 TaxID=2919918 RepID=UPI001F4F853A|nr:TonB-dependent receptor [Pontibacter sp. E15-1]MCJ8167191.1 TonB-dependent receptor [Pontibacter sp. E15-1]
MQHYLPKELKYLFVLPLIFFSFVVAYAQGITVQGKVTDDQGMGLPGVTVLLKGTTTAAPTSVDGSYTLNVPNGNGTLVFTFIGYAPQSVPINNRSTINVSLSTDAKALEEVVVVGYGTQKKETVTGSVAAVKGEELEKSPALNLTNSIAGRMPGVVAVNRSGEPGYDNSIIRIRGSNTLGENGALVVIDGVPARAGGIERLNPADIASISVLKDASAAIYGSRAANGVILVTTKRGKSGKPELSYSFNQGFARPTVIPDLADATQFAEMRNDLEIYNRVPVHLWQEATDAFAKTGSYTLPDGSVVNSHYGPEDFQKFRDGSNPWTHPNTDWYKATLKDWSPQSQHNLQLRGGSDNIQFLTSLGYINQDAFYKNSATGYKQYDLRVNLDATISKYIKASVGMLGRQENRFFPTVGAPAIFRMQMRGIPTSPARWPDGRPGPDIENGQNPVVITTNETGYDRDTRNYLQTNGSVEITNPWIEGLKLTGTAAVDKFTRREKRWQIPWYLYSWDKTSYEADGVTPLLKSGRRGPADPNLELASEDQLNILLGGILTYERSFGNHAITVLAGTNRETIDWDRFTAFRRYFISPAVDQIGVGGNLERNNGGDASERARLSHFGRVAYNYQEKYMAEFLWRYDASDIFPSDTRYGFFPGVLAAWQISEENFFKDNVSFVNYLKLRGSWGQMGNDNLGPEGNQYNYLSTNSFNTYIIGGQEVSTLRENLAPNPNVTWEVANNANIGVDGQLLQGRINFEFDVFYNKRTNILAFRNGSLPQTTGLIPPRENIGEVTNRGWDALIGYNGQIGEVVFRVSANGGYAKNEILFWDEASGAPAHQRSTGSPMGTALRYEYDGVFVDQADIDANPLDYSAIVGTLRPGDMKYKDISGPNGVPDGKITPDDRTRDPRNDIPTFQGGLNANASYKNFDFSVLFQGSAGAVMTLGTGEMGSIGNFLEDIYVNRWTVANPSSEHPRIADRGNQYYSGGNTYWMRSTNYIRLKNIELGYTLPSVLGGKVGLNALRVYVNALNLVTWDKLKVYDPENVNANGQYYPQSKIINTGVTATF